MTTLRALGTAASTAGIVLAMLSAWPAAANDYTFHLVLGGVGDRDGPPMVCPKSHPLLTGFFGRVGSWIDQIGILCSEVLPGWQTGQVTKHEYRGGNGGAKARLATCNANSGIRRIELLIGYNNGKPQHAAAVHFKCYRPSTGKFTSKDAIGASYFRDTPYDEIKTFHQACPGNEYAVGLSTRWGAHVNAIGLICAKLNAPAPIILFPLPGGGQPKSGGKPLSDEPGAAPGGSAPGFPTPDVSPAIPELPQQSAAGTCKQGFVWRQARPSDYVCVTPESRAMVGQENASAYTRWTNGPYGPQTCIAGFVWREAFDGDVVCVTPERRAAVKEENAVSPSRTVSPGFSGGPKNGGGGLKSGN